MAAAPKTQQQQDDPLVAALNLVQKSHESSMQMAEAIKKSETTAAVMANDITYMRADIHEIKEGFKTLGSNYVTRVEFEETLKTIRGEIEAVRESMKPLKAVMWLIGSLVIVGLVGAILKLVILQ